MKSRHLATLIGVAVVALALVAPGSVPGQDRSGQPTDAAKGDAVDAKQIFATSCGWCHQNGGRSSGRGPKLADSQQSDEYLLNRIKTGKQGAMPAFGNMFTEPQLRALVSYIRTLKDSGQ
jgi:mono/diheme cytochrome c family protein